MIVIGCGTSLCIGDSCAYPRNVTECGRTRAAISTELTREHVQEHHDAGVQLATHAFGDRAIGATIDAYRTACPSYAGPSGAGETRQHVGVRG